MEAVEDGTFACFSFPCSNITAVPRHCNNSFQNTCHGWRMQLCKNFTRFCTNSYYLCPHHVLELMFLKSFLLFNITLLCKPFPRPLLLERKMLLQFLVLSYSRLRCTGYSRLILSNEAHCFLYIKMPLTLMLTTRETNAQYETQKLFLLKY